MHYCNYQASRQKITCSKKDEQPIFGRFFGAWNWSLLNRHQVSIQLLKSHCRWHYETSNSTVPYCIMRRDRNTNSIILQTWWEGTEKTPIAGTRKYLKERCPRTCNTLTDQLGCCAINRRHIDIPASWQTSKNRDNVIPPSMRPHMLQALWLSFFNRWRLVSYPLPGANPSAAPLVPHATSTCSRYIGWQALLGLSCELSHEQRRRHHVYSETKHITALSGSASIAKVTSQDEATSAGEGWYLQDTASYCIKWNDIFDSVGHYMLRLCPHEDY